jgi:hypothetical protein
MRFEPINVDGAEYAYTLKLYREKNWPDGKPPKEIVQEVLNNILTSGFFIKKGINE